MNILFVMSISGSIVFLLYLLAKPFSERFLSAHWQYNFLKICLFFYLIPYQCLQDKYLTLYNLLFGTGKAVNSLQYGLLTFKDANTIFISPDGGIHYKYGIPFFIFLSVWLCVVAFVLYRQIKKYRSCRNNLLRLSKVPVDIKPEIPASISQKLPQLAICPFIQSPVTIGLFRPRIILPKDNKPEDLTLYMSHELSHIRNHDALWKFVAFLTMLLHWYNPLVYLFFHELYTVCEKHCDEIVTAPLSETQKLYYENLIINAAQNQTAVSSLFANTFSNNKKQIKERLLFMTRKNLKSAHCKIITALMIGIVVLSMPISVLAYEPIYVYHDLQPYNPNTDFMCIVPEDMQNPYAPTPMMTQLDFTLSDEIIVDEAGNQYIIDSVKESSARSCTHEFINASRASHAQNGAGCTVNFYEGTYCKKCRLCLQENFVSQLTFAKCPH